MAFWGPPALLPMAASHAAAALDSPLPVYLSLQGERVPAARDSVGELGMFPTPPLRPATPTAGGSGCAPSRTGGPGTGGPHQGIVGAHSSSSTFAFVVWTAEPEYVLTLPVVVSVHTRSPAAAAGGGQRGGGEGQPRGQGWAKQAAL